MFTDVASLYFKDRYFTNWDGQAQINALITFHHLNKQVLLQIKSMLYLILPPQVKFNIG